MFCKSKRHIQVDKKRRTRITMIICSMNNYTNKNQTSSMWNTTKISHKLVHCEHKPGAAQCEHNYNLMWSSWAQAMQFSVKSNCKLCLEL